MPLDLGYADCVCFECAECDREHSLRQVYKSRGICRNCRGVMWNLVTEYNETIDLHGRRHNHSILPMLLHVVFGIETHFRDANTVRVVTPRVPADEALGIAKAGWFTYRRLAFHYMELRRDLDGAQEREAMREQGGRNCQACGVFFMPSIDKPWTGAGCCSRACFAKTAGANEVAFQVATPGSAAANAPPTIGVKCRCGNVFQVPAMYAGTRRACPKCGEKSLVGNE